MRQGQSTAATYNEKRTLATRDWLHCHCVVALSNLPVIVKFVEATQQVATTDSWAIR